MRKHAARVTLKHVYFIDSSNDRSTSGGGHILYEHHKHLHTHVDRRGVVVVVVVVFTVKNIPISVMRCTFKLSNWPFETDTFRDHRLTT